MRASTPPSKINNHLKFTKDALFQQKLLHDYDIKQNEEEIYQLLVRRAEIFTNNTHKKKKNQSKYRDGLMEWGGGTVSPANTNKDVSSKACSDIMLLNHERNELKRVLSAMGPSEVEYEDKSTSYGNTPMVNRDHILLYGLARARIESLESALQHKNDSISKYREQLKQYAKELGDTYQMLLSSHMSIRDEQEKQDHSTAVGSSLPQAQQQEQQQEEKYPKETPDRHIDPPLDFSQRFFIYIYIYIYMYIYIY
ncbi:hypothetical protein RFI_20711, partial [Reticulomyxa filosa]